MKEECVYVIGTPSSQTVKIGRTIQIKKRLADIQRMSPVPLEVLWTHPGGRELETNLHRRFASLRSHGEWFTFTEDPVTAVSQAVLEDVWPEPPSPKLQPVVKRRRGPRVPATLLRGQRFKRPLPTGFRDGLTCAFVASADSLTADDIRKMVDLVMADMGAPQ